MSTTITIIVLAIINDRKQIKKPSLPSVFEDDLGSMSSEEDAEINDVKSTCSIFS
tara:strand:- start:229 stop:393 length:165 start_codon:yes stop_codon:yes gene_type:complete